MAETPEVSSKEKILDAAEIAFAELGFDGASLRNIVQNAEVNLATVYYYFGSKEGLMNAVFRRVFDPLRQEQMDRLNSLISNAQGETIPVEAILEAILTPAMRLTQNAVTARNGIATRLIGRIVTDPNPQTQDLLRSQHMEVRKVYIPALQQALPEVPLEDLLWRVEFIWGSLAFILCNPSRINKQTHGICGTVETDLLPQMIACFSAGLRAPAVKR